MIHSTVLDTPIGALSLLTADDHLVAAGFTPEPAQMYARLHPTLRERPLTADPPPAEHSALRRAAAAMAAYFDGDLDALDDLAVHQPANQGRERLWAALRGVPAGSTVTYADLAVKAGMRRSAARAAGGACAANLIAPVVPCHRVVPAGGGLGGYYYGVDRKDWLLKHESR